LHSWETNQFKLGQITTQFRNPLSLTDKHYSSNVQIFQIQA